MDADRSGYGASTWWVDTGAVTGSTRPYNPGWGQLPGLWPGDRAWMTVAVCSAAPDSPRPRFRHGDQLVPTRIAGRAERGLRHPQATIGFKNRAGAGALGMDSFMETW